MVLISKSHLLFLIFTEAVVGAKLAKGCLSLITEAEYSTTPSLNAFSDFCSPLQLVNTQLKLNSKLRNINSFNFKKSVYSKLESYYLHLN